MSYELQPYFSLHELIFLYEFITMQLTFINSVSKCLFGQPYAFEAMRLIRIWSDRNQTLDYITKRIQTFHRKPIERRSNERKVRTFTEVVSRK
jgi:hypothetical protein